MNPWVLVILLTAVVLNGCRTRPEGSTGVIASGQGIQNEAPSPRTVTVLYTSDEHGWMHAHGDTGRGGIVALAHQWLSTESHCIASGSHTCSESSVLALSGGDTWTGPAISAYFHGLPMAKAMGMLGYAASALGNHDLDFGQDALRTNAAKQGYDFLASNLQKAPDQASLPTRKALTLTRNGVRIAVVGLATKGTPIHLMPDSVKGLAFEDEEETLEREIPAAWATEVDAVGVIAHVCPHDLVRMVSNHPEWHLAFAGAGHCHAQIVQHAGKTVVLEPGAELQVYGRVRMTVDLTKPQKDRVVSTDGELVPIGVVPPQDQQTGPVRSLADHVASTASQMRAKLGITIGHTARGIELESPPMIRWILGSWRQSLRTDVAIINRWSMRQSLPPGPITAESVYDILPNDNQLVVLRLKGKELIDNAECCHGFVDGMRQTPAGWVLSNGARIAPERVYSVVTTDYAYFGGAGFHMKDNAPGAKPVIDGHRPIIEWTLARKTTPGHPLEALLGTD